MHNSNLKSSNCAEYRHEFDTSDANATCTQAKWSIRSRLGLLVGRLLRSCCSRNCRICSVQVQDPDTWTQRSMPSFLSTCPWTTKKMSRAILIILRCEVDADSMRGDRDLI